MTKDQLLHLVEHLDEAVAWIEDEDPGSLDAAMLVAAAGIVASRAILLQVEGNR